MRNASSARWRIPLACLIAILFTSGCSDDGGSNKPAGAGIYSFANGCYSVEVDSFFLMRNGSSVQKRPQLVPTGLPQLQPPGF